MNRSITTITRTFYDVEEVEKLILSQCDVIKGQVIWDTCSDGGIRGCTVVETVES